MQQKGRILVVDDEAGLRKLVRVALEREDFLVDEAVDGYECLDKLQGGSYLLVILDLMLPRLDGWSVCREIHRENNVPVMILSARGEELDRLLGFELGADDYLVKPFSPRELIARVKALLRRTAANKDQSVLTFPGMVVDLAARKVLVDNQAVTLTPKEFELLVLLATGVNKVFTREEILSKVWGYDYYGQMRTVDTHINTLRDKLAVHNQKIRQNLATVWGVGYKFEAAQ
jgi:two-component system response regulator ResD